MARFNRRFEVKREVEDGGKIRPDDEKDKANGGRIASQQQLEFEDAKKIGFDDMDLIEEESILENLSENEIRGLIAGYRNMATSGELDAKSFIGSQSKKLGVDKKELETFLKEKAKEEIKSPNKVLHYHRTSMEYAKKIIETGYLLNRKNIELNGGDISHLSGSSSANVQFTRDIYDENGMLQLSGFTTGENKGANSMEVVFVMNPKLMEEESYNCAYTYPIVEKADISECCATILTQNPEIQAQTDKCLEDKGMMIPTMLQEEFDREEILASLNGKEKDNNLQNNFSEEKTKLQEIGTHTDCMYKYTDEIERLEANCFNLYCDHLVNNDIEMSEKGQKDFMGKALGEEYAKLFKDSDKQQLAQIFGRLDYETLYDTKMNYHEEWILTSSTHQKYLLGLQQMKTAEGNVFVAQYEECQEEGGPFETVYQYYTLDENGELVLLENEPQFEQGQQPISCLTQSEITNGLKQREDILINSDKKVLEGMSRERNNNLEITENQQIEAEETDNEETRSEIQEQKETEMGRDKMRKGEKNSFEQSLLSAGFKSDTIVGLKNSIQTVSPNVLLKMDSTLSRTNEQTLLRGGSKDGVEQDGR